MQANPHKTYIINEFRKYWEQNGDAVRKLPIPDLSCDYENQFPFKLLSVQLPDWASCWGVDGKIKVPSCALKNTSGASDTGHWSDVDWFLAMFWYCNGLHERSYEKLKGPVFSYSFKLEHFDSSIWEYAWCNRIALFLREWASRDAGIPADTLFGKLPEHEIILTHDIDAVLKSTLPMLRHSVFFLVNIIRALKKHKYLSIFRIISEAVLFALRPCSYWMFAHLLEIEKNAGAKSIFFLYSGFNERFRSFWRFIIDPSYDIKSDRLRRAIDKINESSCEIGLHQSFGSWENSSYMIREKNRLDAELPEKTKKCRQHWLRFSWLKTWKAQQEAGFDVDFSLGFNDRAAFRNSSATEFHPWDFNENKPMRLLSINTVVMDSHIYGNMLEDDSERELRMKKYIEEIKFVHGTASVLWHQRVFSKDFNWGPIYIKLLNDLK